MGWLKKILTKRDTKTRKSDDAQQLADYEKLMATKFGISKDSQKAFLKQHEKDERLINKIRVTYSGLEDQYALADTEEQLTSIMEKAIALEKKYDKLNEDDTHFIGRGGLFCEPPLTDKIHDKIEKIKNEEEQAKKLEEEKKKFYPHIDLELITDEADHNIYDFSPLTIYINNQGTATAKNLQILLLANVDAEKMEFDLDELPVGVSAKEIEIAVKPKEPGRQLWEVQASYSDMYNREYAANVKKWVKVSAIDPFAEKPVPAGDTYITNINRGGDTIIQDSVLVRSKVGKQQK